MDDNVGGEIGCNRLQRREVFEHRLGCRKPLGLKQHGMTATFQGHVVIVGHPIETVNAKPFGQQYARQMIADKPGGSCNQNPCAGREWRLWGQCERSAVRKFRQVLNLRLASRTPSNHAAETRIRVLQRHALAAVEAGPASARLACVAESTAPSCLAPE